LNEELREVYKRIEGVKNEYFGMRGEIDAVKVRVLCGIWLVVWTRS